MLHGGEIYDKKIELDFSVSLNPLPCPVQVLDEIKAAAYPANIENTILMDQYLIEGTVTEEFDQLSLLSTLVTYVACNSEGRPGHSAAYMDRVTALRKVIEEVYGTEAMRFCGSDGC